MEIQAIISLLEQKFAGVRKDGLTVLAQTIGLTCNTEEDAKNAVDALTADKVNSFITTFRKGVDKEVTTATETRESKLREKYNFVEKTQPQPQPQPNDKTQPNPEDLAQMIAKAISDATTPLMTEIQTLKNDKLTTARRDKVLSLFPEGMSESIKQSIVHDFDAMNFADDAAFDSYLSQKQTDIAALNKELTEAGLSAHHAPTFGKVGNDGVSEAVKSFIESSTNNSNSVGKEFITK